MDAKKLPTFRPFTTTSGEYLLNETCKSLQSENAVGTYKRSGTYRTFFQHFIDILLRRKPSHTKLQTELFVSSQPNFATFLEASHICNVQNVGVRSEPKNCKFVDCFSTALLLNHQYLWQYIIVVWTIGKRRWNWKRRWMYTLSQNFTNFGGP